MINADDPRGPELVRRLGARKDFTGRIVTFGMDAPATLRASRCAMTWEGTTFEVETPRGTVELATPLLGLHNVSNILAAIGCVMDDPCDMETIRAGVAALTGVPGRLELVDAHSADVLGDRRDAGTDVRVVVDYAHTEAALEAVLLTVRSLQPRRVLTVFGCGGNRDRMKRPAMGRVAGRLSAFVCIASDNPRDEVPAAIAQAVAAGLSSSATPHATILDRGEAIAATLARAQTGDCVVIAGKGHETHQIIKDSTIPFDDRQTAARWLRDHQRVAA